ncbi:MULTISPECIES: acyl-protein synthetase [Gammaproteobacteria]|uniref:LuxE/PaaK family acyltransferase n=1 Tax=Gammaproteobacteria TaxID=1236 RepID=UPI000DD04377|nr:MULTISPECIES: acyl-protein synthetase [Gammaproteobacteria]RTE86822.1 acyl-protein synthetase [Aliidiomarina sp. B3213]TCZ93389.1 acyl-protein synthetase [Lysobacter sp. N42]
MDLFDVGPYELSEAIKTTMLRQRLVSLTEHHIANCADYQKLFGDIELGSIKQLEDIPFLTVPLFKQRELKSITKDHVFKVLQSSGTTGQRPSQIYLDAQTAKLQSRVLVKIMQEWLGKQRRHMLIWDHPNVIKDKASFSARGAGIQGLSFLGRNHTYALNDDMSLNVEAINEFHEKFSDQPVFMFGFTFMVWKYGIQALQASSLKLNFESAVLLHSGGWKKLQDEAVSTDTFNTVANDCLGSIKAHNFYGMVEQVGSIFVACEHGYFHAPSTAEVIIRNPETWKPAAVGETGCIQVLSALPESYPGHSLLTEDKGFVVGRDDCQCGRKGTYFKVLGRMAKVEARGCSDTFERGAS